MSSFTDRNFFTLPPGGEARNYLSGNVIAFFRTPRRKSRHSLAFVANAKSFLPVCVGLEVATLAILVIIFAYCLVVAFCAYWCQYSLDKI